MSHTTLDAGFDHLARTYDAEMEANPSMRYMRQVSLATLRATFAPGQRVLEIGCGTGIEAVELAQRGVTVVATDLSAEMVLRARERVRRSALEDRITVHQVKASQLENLLPQYGAGAFEGAYSSFGPLNGEPDLLPVASALARLVRSGGHLVLSVMNRFYAFETVWYLLHGRMRQAARRWRGSAQASISLQAPLRVPTCYHSAASLRRAFSPGFRLTGCRALPLLLPPPYLHDMWDRWPRLWARLTPLEERLAPRWPWRGWGDHLLMLFVRC